MKFYKEVVLKNGETLTIRTPNIDDAEEFANCVNKMKEETQFLSVGADDKKYTLESEIKFFQGYENSANSICLLAVLNGKIAGNVSVGAQGKHLKLRHRGALGIGLLKEFWGKGIAGKLMVEAINFAKSFGFEQLELGVIAENINALKLYKAFGFIEQGRKQRAFKYKDGTYADEIMMVKFFEE